VSVNGCEMKGANEGKSKGEAAASNLPTTPQSLLFSCTSTTNSLTYTHMQTTHNHRDENMPADRPRASVQLLLCCCCCLFPSTTMARPSAFLPLRGLPSRTHRPLLARLFASSPATSTEKIERSDLNVAVVGGGLAGLSTAWHLAGRVKSLTVYDPCPPGQAEASAVAGGLLHPLTPKNRIIWSGLEGFKATLRLVEASKAALSHAGDERAARRLHSAQGTILRPALTPQHVLDYQAAAARLPEWLEWLEGEEWQRRANCPGHGLLLRNSIVLSMPDYLRGLWLSLQQSHGSTTHLTWEQRTFPSPSQAAAAAASTAAVAAAAYDVVVLASGAGICAFPALKDLPIELVKGRTLLVDQQGREGEEGREEQLLGSALLCGEYVVPGVDMGREGEEGREGGEERRVLRCGSTKEYIEDPWGPNPKKEEGGEGEDKMNALREKAERIYPPLKGGPAAYRITTGIRVATQRSNLGKLPILGRISLRGVEKGGKEAGEEGKTWLYTGLGGRGLIHHAFLGERLAEAIVKGEEMMLPSQVRAPLLKEKKKKE